jgi:aryl carrier-like protein
VKVRGFRIELGEIEHAFKQAEPVEDAVVVVREDAPGDHRIVAYVIPRGPEMDLAALKDGVSKVLPDYMVPSAIVVSSAFPLSPNGKIDRKALPPPEAESLKRPAFVGASNALQHVMLDCWRAVLRIQQIGVHDNFFALGGDSVKCVQVVTRARQAGVSCTPNDLFKWPTVAQFSEELSRAQAQAQDAGPPAAAREPDPGGKLEGDELSRIFAKIGR